MLTLIHWLFAIYIFTECSICWDRMNRGDRFCRLAKYSMASLVPFIGVGLCYTLPLIMPDISFIGWCLALWIIPDLAIALFLWPTTYARFTGGFKNRIGDKAST